MASVGRIKVEFQDGSEDLVALTPRVQVALERHFNMSVADTSRAEHIYFAAYIASQQKGRFAGVQFDEFLDQLVDADFVEDEDVDPTRPAPPTTRPSD